MASKPTTPLGAVRGFEIMNSLGDTMRAVLETNKPYSEDIKTGGLSVTFDGKEAFSSWMRNGRKEISGVLNAPALSPDAHLSRNQADLYVGYGLHEMGHMCYSEHGPFQKMHETQGPMGTALLKALEDPRVEEAVMGSKMAGNSKALFENMACAMYSNAMTQGYDANDINWLPLTLSLLGRDRRGQHFPEAKDIRAAMNPENMALVDEALKMMDKASLDASGTEDARAAAQHIIDKLNIPPQPQQGKPQPQQGKGKGKPQEGEGEGEGGEGEGEGQEGQGEGQGEGGEGEGQGQGKGSGKGQPKDGKGEPKAQPKEGKEGEGKGKGERKGPPQQSDGNSYADGGGGSGFSKHGSGARWKPIDLAQAKPKAAGPEQALDVAAIHANNQAKKEGSRFDADKFPCAIGNEYDFRKGKSYEGYLNAQGRGRLPVYEGLKKRLPTDLGSMRHALWRLLNSRDEAFVNRYNEEGRWDQRAMTRMLAGSQSLYKMTTDVMGLKTAVSIIVDASGSMAGINAQNSASVCIALAETMEQLAGHGVVYQIACFEDFDGGKEDAQGNSFLGKFNARSGWAGNIKNYAAAGRLNEITDAKAKLVPDAEGDWRKRMKYTRHIHAANIAVFKGFNDRLAMCKDSIAMMAGFADGGTPDAAGVGRAIYHVLNRPEPNKIVMVITDGCGFVDEVRKFCAFGEKVGVDVIGVGIGRTDVANVYPIAVTAESIDQLGKAAFGKMVQVVMNNRRKTGRKAA